MTSDATGHLERLLQELGVGSIASLLILLAVPIAIAGVYGLHVLATGWHTRRKEFFEMYEKLPHENPDPLALETAFRHGFGLWIPAATIHLIRDAPSPSAPLVGLMTMMRFLETNSADGTLAVKPMFSTPTKRTLWMSACAVGFLTCSYALALSLLSILKDSQEINVIPYAVILIFSLFSGAFSMGTGFDLFGLKTFVDRHPYLFKRKDKHHRPESLADRPASKDQSRAPHSA